ncbi:MAG: polyprenyl synthetase family protein [Pseudomonadota bacterium]
MDADALIEWALENAVSESESPPGPPRLASAIRHAVFPGGARVRPQLCLAVAAACHAGSKDELLVSAGAGAALELLHCASLIHDDLPCFDGAETRRGKPSVHVAFGEPIALLAGDALIVMAFSTLARSTAGAPETLARLLPIVTEAVGAPNGIVAGQAWESEPGVETDAYHRAKTGALFIGAAQAGAASVGADPSPWRKLGEYLGDAYQVADDLRDVLMDEEALGKPVGQDRKCERPNAASDLGPRGAMAKLNGLIEAAADSVPDCDGAPMLRTLVHAQAARLIPASLARALA